MKPDEMKLCSLVLGWAALIYIISYSLQFILPQDDSMWLSTLLINLSGYATVLLPGYLGLKYVRDSGYLDRSTGRFANLVRLFYAGKPDVVEDDSTVKSETAKKDRTVAQEALQLLFCGVGLQGSYLTWGILQEKIMTREYRDSAGNAGRFTDAQFLVFVNRILAFAVALVVMLVSKQPRLRSPLYKFSYCSFSNIMSSWCQYEALKYVSFPTQVLAKASKIIPVMLMGKLVSKKKYEFYEYLVALIISLGMMAFLFGKDRSADNGTSTVTTVSGIVILVGYMAFDAFTSNWQGELFKEYSMSSVQMMAGVNLFSCLLTSVSLLQQGIFVSSLFFMSQYPAFVSDCVVLSLCSACGQLFIYHTIATFGPVVFVIIMTVRQVLAVILSCIIYGHAISATSLLGVVIVFLALFLKIYCAHRVRLKKKGASKVSTVNA